MRRAIAFLAFEERHDCHGVAVPQTKVDLELGHHGAGVHARLELTTLREALSRRELAEVLGDFAGFRLDVVELGLKGHRNVPGYAVREHALNRHGLHFELPDPRCNGDNASCCRLAFHPSRRLPRAC